MKTHGLTSDDFFTARRGQVGMLYGNVYSVDTKACADTLRHNAVSKSPSLSKSFTFESSNGAIHSRWTLICLLESEKLVLFAATYCMNLFAKLFGVPSRKANTSFTPEKQVELVLFFIDRESAKRTERL